MVSRLHATVPNQIRLGLATRQIPSGIGWDLHQLMRYASSSPVSLGGYPAGRSSGSGSGSGSSGSGQEAKDDRGSGGRAEFDGSLGRGGRLEGGRRSDDAGRECM